MKVNGNDRGGKQNNTNNVQRNLDSILDSDDGFRLDLKQAEITQSAKPEPTPEPEPQAGRVRGRDVVLLSFAGVALVLSLWSTVTFAFGKTEPVETKPTQLETMETVPETLPVTIPEEDLTWMMAPKSVKTGVYNILIASTDFEDKDTDTTLILQMNSETKKLHIMGVPGSTFAYVNDSVPQLRHLYPTTGGGEAGVKALAREMEFTFGVTMDAYVMVNHESFVQLIDSLGGITFDVPEDMNQTETDEELEVELEQGEQKLDGKKALELNRYYGYVDGNLDRLDTQMDFLAALLEQGFAPMGKDEVAAFCKDFLKDNITNLTQENIAYLCKLLSETDFAEVTTDLAPGQYIKTGGVSYWALDEAEVLELMNAYFNTRDKALTSANIHIRDKNSIPTESGFIPWSNTTSTTSPTTKPTNTETESPTTDPTGDSTEPSTDATTEPSTDAPTEPSTEAPPTTQPSDTTPEVTPDPNTEP